MYEHASLAQNGIIYVSKEFPRKGFFSNVRVQSTNLKKSCFSSFSRKVHLKKKMFDIGSYMSLTIG
jgi:hypothetical protein